MLRSVRLLETHRFVDERGWFSETFSARKLEDEGIDVTFVQDNLALSHAPGTLRGLHFQAPPHAQAKLVRCISGAVFDVAVDIRKGSPTYGRWAGAELSAANGRQLFVPAGFAHGYMTLEPMTQVFYKVSNFYAPKSEGGIRFDDAQIGIAWPLPGSAAIVARKDQNLPLLADFVSPFDYDGIPLQRIEAT